MHSDTLALYTHHQWTSKVDPPLLAELPRQVNPSPLYPLLQVQSNDSSVLVQTALLSQGSSAHCEKVSM